MTDAKARILVVDDNPANLALYERVIADVPNCTVESFTSPIEALASATDHAPAFAIVDYRMPVMDGLAFIRDFRSIPGCESVPLVMLTAVADSDLRAQAGRLGIEFLTKPLDKQLLIALVKRVTGSPPQEVHRTIT